MHNIKFHEGIVWFQALLRAIEKLRDDRRLDEEAYARFLKRKKQINLILYCLMAFFFLILLNRPLLGLVLVLCGALLIYVVNIRGMDKAALLHIEGSRTEGEIIKVKMSHYRGKYWEIKCKYSTPNGEAHYIVPPPSQLYVNAMPDWTPYEGEKVEIVYDLSNPQKANLILPAEYNVYDLVKKERES